MKQQRRSPNSARHPLVLGLAILTLSTMLTGCLETREEEKQQEQAQIMRKQVSTLQQTTADVNARFQDVDDELRKVNGRVSAVDSKVQQTNTLLDKGFGLTDGKFKEKEQMYREEFAKLHSEIDALKAQLATYQEDQKKAAEARAASEAEAAAKAKETEESNKDPFSVAESKFKEKSWREAILAYEKYRKANPKGKQFAMATYKIGVSFQELGSSDDARAFYEEVISKFPKTKEAKSAGIRLKSLKK